MANTAVVYDRTYGNQTVNFEASGGLVNSSLVMQDRETDTYWSIMSGEALAGELAGEKLIELPVSKKMKWEDWVELHPNTLVLSVSGKEDIRMNPYDDYFQNSNGFRNQSATDKRMKTKEPIYAFGHNGKKYATSFKEFKDGRVFALDDGSKLFIYRRRKADLFESTAAFISNGRGFEEKDGNWVDLDSGAHFDEKTGAFIGSEVERLNGFDTFWYNWSLNNPETEVLR